MVDDMEPFDKINERIWEVPADIFIPAAASRLVTEEQLRRLYGLELKPLHVARNVPFADDAIFYGPIMSEADKQISLFRFHC